MSNLISMWDYLNKNPEKTIRHTALYNELYMHKYKPEPSYTEPEPYPTGDMRGFVYDPLEAEINALEAKFKASYTDTQETE